MSKFESPPRSRHTRYSEKEKDAPRLRDSRERSPPRRDRYPRQDDDRDPSRRDDHRSYRRTQDREDRSGRGYYDDRNRREGENERFRDNRNAGNSRFPDRQDGYPAASHSRRSPSPRQPSQPRSRSGSPPVDKAKPNFNPSGLLAAATKTVSHDDGTATVLKYHEPPEARKPTAGWRLYVFKGTEQVDMLHLHLQSAYLIGRDKMVSDIPIDHPSCSKQHAVIQYRQVKPDKGSKPVVKPFIIDLESTNTTKVNGEAIPTSRYYELHSKDIIKFGLSTREYVLIHDEE